MEDGWPMIKFCAVFDFDPFRPIDQKGEEKIPGVLILFDGSILYIWLVVSNMF